MYLTQPHAAPADETADTTPETTEGEIPAVASVEAGPIEAAADVETSDAAPAVQALPVIDADDDGGADGDAEEDDAEDEIAPPRTVFADLGLSEPILKAVLEMGYMHPTPIQEQAIPFVLMGRDVLGCAQTGTGKTASFTLPMMDILAGSRARARMPRSLILEPTRELALQVAENFVQYGKYLKLNHALLIGGESLSDQRDALMRGVDVLIATPGRLIDLFERGGLLLTDAKLLVIDEADRMLDMGFIPDVERIVAMLPKTRQTLFFSATMAPEIRRLADAFLQNPKEVTVSKSASVATTITAGLVLVAEDEKREALRRLIASEAVQNALVFCNRKKDVDILFKSLGKHGFSVGALHGDMSQPQRFATLEKFKANELRLLVCSDVAARGLDIGGLSHVFNFDVPHHAEDYVHRIGRTGRAGNEGRAFTIATPEDRLNVAAIEKLTGMPIPPVVIEGLETVAWSEDAPRRGRGRGRGASGGAAKAPARKAPEAKRDEASASDRPEPRGARAPRKRGGRSGAAPEVPGLGPQPVVAALETPESVFQAPAEPFVADRSRESRDRDYRDARPRAPRGSDHPEREFRGRDRGPRDRPRRDDDLGPSVLGFGGEVPAFMLLPVRVSRARHAGEALEDDDVSGEDGVFPETGHGGADVADAAAG
jgi:superfamily II DNA/RNA helicase